MTLSKTNATESRLASRFEERLLGRNQLFEYFFLREAPCLAEACREVSERFFRGGRVPAFGRGPFATSCGSRNIVAALEEAHKRNLLTVALLGYDGGEINRRRLADFSIVVNCDYIPRIQEVQASICHVMREMLEVQARGQA